MKKSIQERANQWMVSDDTGVSSKAIWAVMMGVKPTDKYHDTPCDPDDFGRCYRLLKLIPEWIPKLNDLKKIDFSVEVNGGAKNGGWNEKNKWSTFFRCFKKWSKLYEEEKYSELYKEMSNDYKFAK